MSEDGLYHQGSRELQGRFDSRRIADRLQEVTVHDRFTEQDRAFVERSPMFFLATADAQGRPDVSYKGGLPGFVRVVSDSTLAFPNYDGNGMFKSLGNVLVNPLGYARCPASRLARAPISPPPSAAGQEQRERQQKVQPVEPGSHGPQ